MSRTPVVSRLPFADAIDIDDKSDCATQPVAVERPPTTKASTGYPTFDRYEIHGEIGRGGMGVVFKAVDRDLKRPVAIKMILSGALAADDALARFRAEMEAVGRLNHPNLVRIYESGYFDNRPYAVMEYIEGGTLADHIAYRLFDPAEAAHIVADLADGIESAHQRGVLHRDLKPANVLLNGTQPKIVDFGLAKLSGATDCTQTGDVIGSPHYMAPERITGPKAAIGVGVDIYALGAILFEILTRQRPFEGDSPADVLRRVIDQDAPNVRTLRRDVSRDLATICQKCMQKQPAKRYATSKELADDLRRYLRGEPIKARPIGATERAWRWGRRNPAVACTLGLLLLMLTGIAVAATLAAQWYQQSARELGQILAEKNAESLRNEWLMYQTNMAAVSSSLQLNNHTTAAAALDRAPVNRQGWEWRYFKAQMDHSEFVLDARDNPIHDGHYNPKQNLLLLHGGHTILVYDAHTHEQRDRLTTTGTVSYAYFTPDGHEIIWSELDGRVIFYNLARRERRELDLPQRMQTNADAWRIHYAPDGQTLCLVRNNDNQGTIVFLPPGAKQPLIRELDVPIGRARLTPDSQQLIVITKYKFMVWNVATGTLQKSVNSDRTEFYTSAISPCGTRFACSGQYPRHQMELWDVTTGTQLATMTTHSNSIMSMVFSADGRWLVSGSRDESACLWDGRTGRLHKELHGHTQYVNWVGFTPDQRTVLTASFDATVRLWDVATGHSQVVLRGHDNPINHVVLNENGNKMLSIGHDAIVRGWDLAAIRRQHVLGKHERFVYGVATHPTKPYAVSAAWDGTLREWNWRTGELVRQLPLDKHVFTAVTYDATGERLYAISREGNDRAHFHEWRGLELRPRTRDARGGYWELETNVAISPDQRWLAVGGEHGYITLWPANGQGAPQRYTVPPVNGQAVNTGTVAWHPNGHEFAATTAEGVLLRWSFDKPNEPQIWPTPTRITNHVLYSPDGRWLLSAGDRQVNVWEARTLALQKSLPHGGKVFQMAYHPKEARMVTACSDNSIRIWDMEEMDEVAELRGHAKYVHSVAFTPDGERLISGSGDGTVRVWSAEAHKRSPTQRPDVK